MQHSGVRPCISRGCHRGWAFRFSLSLVYRSEVRLPGSGLGGYEPVLGGRPAGPDRGGAAGGLPGASTELHCGSGRGPAAAQLSGPAAPSRVTLAEHTRAGESNTQLLIL